MGLYTNKMRYTGTSGVDVESMVQTLMKAESLKTDRLYKQKTKLEWQQTATRNLGNSVRNFRDSYLSFSSANPVANMRSTASFAKKSISGSFTGGSALANGSGSNVLKLGSSSTVTASADIANGDYKVSVKSAASAETYAGTAKEGSAVSKVALDASKVEADDYMDITINGTKKRISFSADDVTAINAAGNKEDAFAEMLQSKIDTAFGTLSGKSKVNVGLEDGKLAFTANASLGTTFSLTMNSGITSATSVTSNTSLSEGVTNEDGTFNIKATDTYVINGKEIAVDIESGGTKASYLEDLNKKLSAEGISATATLNSDGKLIIKAKDGEQDVTVESATRKVTDEETGDVFTDTAFGMSGTSRGGASLVKTLGFDSTDLSSTFNTASKMGVSGTDTLKFGDGSTLDIEVTEDMTYQQYMDKVNASGKATISFNKTTNSFKIVSKATGEAGTIDLSNASILKEKANLSDVPSTAAKNAEVEITDAEGNKQTIIRDTNTFSYGGFTFNLDSGLNTKIAESATGSIDTEISISSNTDSAYDTIKGFIESYNKMLDELYSAVNKPAGKSGSYSGYEPLTDEEKEGLSDTQIATLEAKAKEGLLYRDDNFTRLSNNLRDAMNSQITLADGSKISLASIGITTGDYSQGGKLFIKDEGKLREALEKNPDGVASVFTDAKNGVAEKAYNVIEAAVGANGYITKKAGFEDSVYVENNYYSKQITSKQKELDRLMELLADKENHYYKMFSSMETAINKANSDMATLSSYM